MLLLASVLTIVTSSSPSSNSFAELDSLVPKAKLGKIVFKVRLNSVN